MSKSKHRKEARRRVRRMEKTADTPRDTMIGRACRRLYGQGLAKGYAAKAKDRRRPDGK